MLNTLSKTMNAGSIAYIGRKQMSHGDLLDSMRLRTSLRRVRLLGSTLDEVAKMNIEKLRDRAMRNVIIGEGDNR